MDFYFFDSSAIVKNYIAENGSDWVKATLRASHTKVIYAISLSKVEVVSAIVRRSKTGALSLQEAVDILREFRAAFSKEFRTIDIDNILIERALNAAENHGLRAYDSVQLSAAAKLSEELTSENAGQLIFVSADEQLNAIALKEGLEVVNPNDHN
jgi:predicted nucleic acid-binding protein